MSAALVALLSSHQAEANMSFDIRNQLTQALNNVVKSHKNAAIDSLKVFASAEDQDEDDEADLVINIDDMD